MKGRLLALTACLLLIGAAPAAADQSPFGGQSAAQSAGNMQSATSNATSTQYDPSNQNISVRVLSPGNDGNVSQANNSSAESGAANLNATGQGVSQSQSGSSGTSCCDAAQEAMQQAAQWAGNKQSADSSATSTQKDPSNGNISVRVLSPGDNGSVDQSNNSDAESFAGNLNKTKQNTRQNQGSSDETPVRKSPSANSSDQSDGRVSDPCGCNSGGGYGSGGSEAIQAAGQDAGSQQYAKSDATSTQYHPSNENISVRVLSPGDNGDVSQSNNSYAGSFAGNANFTKQDIEQSQPGTDGGCGCKVIPLKGQCCTDHSTGIQAAGQDAWNNQDAESDATSTQYGPSNVNKSLRLKDGFAPHPEKKPYMKEGCGCDSSDSGYTPADGTSGGGYKPGGDSSDGSYTPVRKPAPEPTDDSGGDVSQENNSTALSHSLNLNGLWQGLFQSQGGGEVLLT
ncbi:MAG TPA: hypothetical protein VGI67_10155 [Thermoleophilaceae bacterium]|jgi:hypothetical protein